ncbi:MAG: SusC/RagA family TonB-linked outer membrane protein [Flavobacteriaceae bacterium]
MKKKVFLFGLALSLFFSVNSFAQSITGTVKSSEDDFVLPDVNIVVKGSANGTISDFDGNYKIKAKEGDILLFSYIGYEDLEVVVGKETKYDVVLNSMSTNLGTIVITALGIKRERRELGYSISEVKGKDLQGTAEMNAISSLSGKIAGVEIGQTNSGSSGSHRVLIRGISQIEGNNQPLYVIDGVPVQNGSLGQADQWGGLDLGDGLGDINPEDIKSVSVLKGAGASALYGSRALNGVILITTKKGKKKNDGKGLGVETNTTVTFDNIHTQLTERQEIYGQGSSGRFPRTDEPANLVQSNWGPKYDGDYLITLPDGIEHPFKYVENNIQGFFRQGVTTNNSIAVSGGGEDTSIRFSVNNVSNEDIVPNSNLNRLSIGLRANTKLSEKLKLDAKVTYITDEVNNRPALTDAVTNIGNPLIGLAGNVDQAYLQHYVDENGDYVDWNSNIYRANPYWTINKTFNKSNKNRILGFASIDYQMTDNWNFKVKTGIDQFAFNIEQFYDKGTPTKEGGFMQENNFNVQEFNIDGIVQYAKQINDKWYFSISGGANLSKQNTEELAVRGSGIINSGQASMSNFATVIVTPRNPRKEVQSVYAYTSINYGDYLFLDLTGRNDWSSTLPTDNNSYFYPSASMSFVFTDAFEMESDVLPFGKLRLSYAQVGGDTDPFRLAFEYGLTGLSHLGQPLGSILGETIPNGNLLPEKSNSYEIGTDLKFLKGRVNLDVSYYSQVVDNQILRLEVPETTGYRYASVNAGSIENKGLELLLSASPIKTENFKWNIAVNYAQNQNSVTKLHDDVKIMTISDARWAGVKIIAEEGKEFGTITGAGYQRDPNGNIIHGSDGMPLIGDVQKLGNSLHKWTGGLTNSFSFKGITLKTSIDAKFGADIYSITNSTMYSNGSHSGTVEGRDGWNDYVSRNDAASIAWTDAGNDPDDFVNLAVDAGYVGGGVVNVGTEDNPEYIKNEKFVDPSRYWGFVSDNIPEQYVYDASYVKLRDVSISYKLPKKTLKKLPFNGISIGVVGRNLLTLYKNVDNIDPESNYNNGNGQGLEYGSLPTRKSYGFNVRLKF